MRWARLRGETYLIASDECLADGIFEEWNEIQGDNIDGGFELETGMYTCEPNASGLSACHPPPELYP